MSWWEIILGVFGYVAVAVAGLSVAIWVDDEIRSSMQNNDGNVIWAGFLALLWPVLLTLGLAVGVLIGTPYGLAKLAQYTGVRMHAASNRHEVRQAKIKALEEEVGIGKDMILYDERSGGIG